MADFDSGIQYLKGVGPKRAELFEKLGIKTVRDLIYHLPRSYMDFTSPTAIASARPYPQGNDDIPPSCDRRL